MLETRAIVKQIDGDKALVEAANTGGCGQCAGKGCGSSKMSSLFCVRPGRFEAHNSARAKVGEEVLISINDGTLFYGTMILYGLPLLFLFVGALLAEHFAGDDIGAAIGGILGLVVGFFLSWLAARRFWRSIGPAIIHGNM